MERNGRACSYHVVWVPWRNFPATSAMPAAATAMASRLEINFIRLLSLCEGLASEKRGETEWRLEKVRRYELVKVTPLRAFILRPVGANASVVEWCRLLLTLATSSLIAVTVQIAQHTAVLLNHLNSSAVDNQTKRYVEGEYFSPAPFYFLVLDV